MDTGYGDLAEIERSLMIPANSAQAAVEVARARITGTAFHPRNATEAIDAADEAIRTLQWLASTANRGVKAFKRAKSAVQVDMATQDRADAAVARLIEAEGDKRVL